jgi:hypothetical protein
VMMMILFVKGSDAVIIDAVDTDSSSIVFRIQNRSRSTEILCASNESWCNHRFD